MKAKLKSQAGVAHLALLLVLAVVVVIAFAGYKVSQNKTNKPVNNSAAPAASQPLQSINSQADLNKAVNTLNAQSVDSSLNPDGLNQDVNSLL